MDYINVAQSGGNVVITGLDGFNLDDILDCGQCFRWERLDTGDWRGIVRGKCRRLRQRGDTLTFLDTGMDEFDEIWYGYFDLGRDYAEVRRVLSTDGHMRRAVEFTPGMRVLRQEPWEALCSFILSQNNNIKRIKGLVERLCENFGQPCQGGFAFPSAKSLASLTEEELRPIRCGFRAGYVLDAARRVATGETDLDAIGKMPLKEAGMELQKIRGVGPKVAACALLYGFGRAECVPVDVWIDRALKEFYPGGMPPQIADIAGLGQQYLFHYIRHRDAAAAK